MGCISQIINDIYDHDVALYDLTCYQMCCCSACSQSCYCYPHLLSWRKWWQTNWRRVSGKLYNFERWRYWTWE